MSVSCGVPSALTPREKLNPAAPTFGAVLTNPLGVRQVWLTSTALTGDPETTALVATRGDADAGLQ